ncbi:MAG: SxtJ family membrane protein [Planctomycetota bacterium]
MALLEINWEPSKKELRQFAGIWFPLACAMLCFIAYKATGSWLWPALLGSVGAVLAVIAFVKPVVAQRLFVGWMIAAYPIGWTISHILMGLIYYLLITPMGLIMRCCGRDAMGRKFDPSRDSYWVPHQAPQDKKRYFRQY